LSGCRSSSGFAATGLGLKTDNAHLHAIATRLVKLLLDNGANIESSDERGATPLHMATHHDAETVVKLLLDFGANIIIQSKISKWQCVEFQGHVRI
jgi:ankyrin repeat protein